MELLGFCEMKKTEGKVLFVVDREPSGSIVGYSTDKLFVYGDVSKKISAADIGKEISCVWGQGYNGKAYLADINIK